MYGEITDASRLSLENLKQWHVDYLMATSIRRHTPKPTIVQVLDDDTINSDQIEQQISLCASRLPAFAYLCGECRQAFDNWPALDEGQIRRTDTIALEAATRKGCRFCSFLFHFLIDNDEMNFLRRVEGRLQLLGECIQFEVHLTTVFTNVFAVIKPPGRAPPLDLSRSSLPIAYLVPNADTCEYPIDSHEISNRWLRECHQGHEACIADARGNLPTRLVRVADGDVRLVVTAEWTTKPRYATLSHCWGTIEFLQLRKHNMDEFLCSIPVESLPQTFKDAIQITRKLELEYLWIDSLCIIQDDDSDWQAEAGQMSVVYGGSFVNIAASSAKSAHKGCFLKSENRIEAFRAAILRDNDTRAAVQFERRNSYAQHVLESHLTTRAWAFQEKILSPRTIHFGNRGMFWECSSKRAIEFLPDELITRSTGMIGSLRKYGPSQKWWADAVKLYTAADITVSRDKLPALSGVAKRVHELSGCDYLAGIWRHSSIEHDLCWSVRLKFCRLKGRSLRLSPRLKYRAPSWSWASVDDPVLCKFQLSKFELYAQVVDGWTTPAAGQDQFGEVTDGALIVTCSALLEVLFADYSTGNGNSVEVTLISGQNLYIQSWKDSSEAFEGNDKHRCFLLPLIKRKGTIATWTWGILIRSTNRCKGEFQRVGMFETVPPKDTDVDHFSHALGLQGEATARAECAEIIANLEHPSRRFVITIV